MNAYELADKLDKVVYDLECIKIFAWEQKTAADMLRQQADRIAELENVVSFWKNMYQDLNDILGKYKTLNPPHKKLNDEEINAVWFSVKGDLKDFAKAIIKASRGKE